MKKKAIITSPTKISSPAIRFLGKSVLVVFICSLVGMILFFNSDQMGSTLSSLQETIFTKEGRFPQSPELLQNINKSPTVLELELHASASSKILGLETHSTNEIPPSLSSSPSGINYGYLTLDGAQLLQNKTVPSSGLRFLNAGWLGLNDSQGRIVFANTAVNSISVLDAYMGIGTASPSAMLEVNGSFKTSGLVSLPGLNQVATSSSVLVADQNGLVSKLDISSIRQDQNFSGWDTNAADDITIADLHSHFIQPANNLSDLGDITLARTNLGLGNLATLSTSDLDSKYVSINQSTNQVGIGTATPAYKLDVLGNFHSLVIGNTYHSEIIQTETGSIQLQAKGKLELRATNGYQLYNYLQVDGGIHNTELRGTWKWRDGNTFSSGSEVLRLNANAGYGGLVWQFNVNQGNYDAIFKGQTDANLLYIDGGTSRLGVGTATPSAKLDVIGSTRIQGSPGANILSVTTSNPSNAMVIDKFGNVVFYQKMSVANPSTSPGFFNISGGSAANPDISGFFMKGVSGQVSKYIEIVNAGSASQLVLTNTGDVGIGVAAPSAKLHVNGTMQVAGATNFNGTTTHSAITLSRSAPDLRFDDTGEVSPEGRFVLNADSAALRVRGRNAIDNGWDTVVSFSRLAKVGVAQSTFFGAAVFNEAGGTYDFRVEGAGNQNLLFVQSSTNRIGIGTNTPTHPLQVGTANGAYLTSGGAWTDGSSVTFKENFQDLNPQDILNKIATLNIKKWNYKVQSNSVQHIGPFAEDFYSTFGVGDDNQHLAALDTAGVALLGIQGLKERIEAIELNANSQTALQKHITWTDELVSFLKEVVFESTVLFKSNVTFISKVFFKDEITVNENVTGTLEIPAMATKARVTFSKAFSEVPVLSVIPQQSLHTDYKIIDITTQRFTVAFSQGQSEKSLLTWIALISNKSDNQTLTEFEFDQTVEKNQNTTIGNEQLDVINTQPVIEASSSFPLASQSALLSSNTSL